MSEKQPLYRAYLITEQGERQPIDARSIVIELEPDKEIELDLQPHPNYLGGLEIRAGSELDSSTDSGHLSMLVVRPGGCNLVHLSVEQLPWRDLPPQMPH